MRPWSLVAGLMGPLLEDQSRFQPILRRGERERDKLNRYPEVEASREGWALVCKHGLLFLVL